MPFETLDDLLVEEPEKKKPKFQTLDDLLAETPSTVMPAPPEDVSDRAETIRRANLAFGPEARYEPPTEPSWTERQAEAMKRLPADILAGTGETVGNIVATAGEEITKVGQIPIEAGRRAARAVKRGMESLGADPFGRRIGARRVPGPPPSPTPQLPGFKQVGEAIREYGRETSRLYAGRFPGPEEHQHWYEWLTEPGKTLRIALRSAPQTVGTAAATVVGGPAAGIGLAYAGERESIYQSTLQRLGTDRPDLSDDERKELSNTVADLVGPFNAFVEYASARTLLNLGAPAKKVAIDAAINRILAQMPKTIINVGTSRAAAVGLAMMSEGAEGAVQNLATELGQKGVAGLEIEPGLWKREFDSFMAEGIVGGLFETGLQAAGAQGAAHAEDVRGDTGRPGEAGIEPEAGEADRGRYLQQAPAEPSVAPEAEPEAQGEGAVSPEVVARVDTLREQADKIDDPVEKGKVLEQMMATLKGEEVAAPVAEPTPTVTPTEVVPAEGKQAWEMTTDEFSEYEIPLVRDAKRFPEIDRVRQALTDGGVVVLDIGVTGSQAAGVSGPKSDVDVYVRVPDSQWNNADDIGARLVKDEHIDVLVNWRGIGKKGGQLRGAKTHKRLVEQALKEGKPVPAAVLADYPDLAEKYGKKPAPPAGEPAAAPAVSTDAEYERLKAEVKAAVKEKQPTRRRKGKKPVSKTPPSAVTPPGRVSRATPLYDMLAVADRLGIEPSGKLRARLIDEINERLAADEVAEQAKRDVAGGAKGETLSMLGVGQIENMAKMGTYWVRKGYKTFVSWSRQMVKELGEWVRPHLREIWQKVQELHKSEEGAAPIKPRQPLTWQEYLDEMPNYTTRGLDIFYREAKAAKKTQRAEALLAEARRRRDAGLPIPDSMKSDLDRPQVSQIWQKAQELHKREEGFLKLGAKQKRVVAPDIQFPDPDVEAAMEAAHGVQPNRVIDDISEFFVAIGRKMTRAEEFIPNTAEMAVAHNFFRSLKDLRHTVPDLISRKIVGVVQDLTPAELDAMERLMNSRNMLMAINHKAPDGTPAPQPLRFRIKDPAAVHAYNAQMEAVVAKMPKVQAALQIQRNNRLELIMALRSLNIVPQTWLDHVDEYVHQMVLSKVQEAQLASRATAHRIKRSAQKGRIVGPTELGVESDWNTSYIESEFMWMSEMTTELRKEQGLRTLNKQYGIKSQLVAEAKVAKVDDWRRMLKNHPDYGIWQPAPGNIFYQSYTLAEKIAEQVLQASPRSWPVDSADLRKALMMGGRRGEYVLPNNIIEQLNVLEKPKASNIVVRGADAALRLWKYSKTSFPVRAIPYNFNNAIGDVEPVIAAAPGALLRIPRDIGELWKYYFPGKHAAKLSPHLERAIGLGVLDASFAAQEIIDIKELTALRRFFAGDRSPGVITAVLQGTTQLTRFREAILRYSTYGYYLDKLNKGELFNYGGAKKSVVDAIARDLGNDKAAAHLTNNLIGDYADRTVFGNYMKRRVSPFFSWQEINFWRWGRMGINAYVYGKAKGGMAGGIGGIGGQAVTRLSMQGLHTVLSAKRMLAIYIGLYLWNHLFFPDEEEKLSDADKNNPHMIFGRERDDGTIPLKRGVGALGDFGGTLGINQMLEMAEKWQAGQVTTGEVLTEGAKAAIGKQIMSVRPEAQWAIGVVLGVSMYPDAFNPRTTTAGEATLRLVGAEDIYPAIKGKVAPAGERARPHTFPERIPLGIGIVNSAENALSATHDLRQTFLAKEGQERPPVFGKSAITTMRRAVSAGDQEAFNEARRAYLEKGKDYKNFKQSIAYIDPIARRLNAEMEVKFENFLTSAQRERVKIARDYARALEIQMWKWWYLASAEDTPAQKLVYKEALDKEIAAKVQVIDRKPKSGMPRAKRLELRNEQEQARQWLAERGVSLPRARRTARQAESRR